MDLPVPCLDTCVVLDILRDPVRKDVRVHEHEASLALLSAAQSGPALETLVAEQVSREYRDNVEQVQQEAGRSIGALTRQIGKLDALVALYGPSRRTDPGLPVTGRTTTGAPGTRRTAGFGSARLSGKPPAPSPMPSSASTRRALRQAGESNP